VKLPQDLKPGDILLYKPSNWIGVVIACLTGGWFSHVEGYWQAGLSVGAREEGVNVYPVRIDKYLVSVRRPMMRGFPFCTDGAYKAVAHLLGKPYDVGSLFRFLAAWKTRRHVARMCSSVMTAFLRGGGCNPFNAKVQPAKVSPYDLWMSPELNTVWGR
jgi:hypothetical protein